MRFCNLSTVWAKQSRTIIFEFESVYTKKSEQMFSWLQSSEVLVSGKSWLSVTCGISSLSVIHSKNSDNVVVPMIRYLHQRQGMREIFIFNCIQEFKNLSVFLQFRHARTYALHFLLPGIQLKNCALKLSPQCNIPFSPIVFFLRMLLHFFFQ